MTTRVAASPPGHDDALAILDGHFLIFRSYHALPELRAPDGTAVHAVLGFAQSLLKLRPQLPALDAPRGAAALECGSPVSGPGTSSLPPWCANLPSCARRVQRRRPRPAHPRREIQATSHSAASSSTSEAIAAHPASQNAGALMSNPSRASSGAGSTLPPLASSSTYVGTNAAPS